MNNKGGYICVPSFVSFMEGNNMLEILLGLIMLPFAVIGAAITGILVGTFFEEVKNNVKAKTKKSG